jgi:hypothetical protein
MKHARPSIAKVLEQFDKNWFPYDYEGKHWQDSVPTMSTDFTNTLQNSLYMDMLSIWNAEGVDGTHFDLYKLCRHKIHLWLDKDFTTPKTPKVNKKILKDLKYNQEHKVVVDRPKIVLMECLAGEVITLIQGRIELRFDFATKGKPYFVLGRVEIEHKLWFNAPKEFILP